MPFCFSSEEAFIVGKPDLDGSEDYTRLSPNYKYVSVNEYGTCLTDEEIKIFMGLLLHPNRLCIGKAIALTKYKLKEQSQSFIPAYITVRNFIGLVEALKSNPKNIPKMELVYGEPGLGKSQTALWIACKYDGIYIRASNLMTSIWLLKKLLGKWTNYLGI